MCIRLTKKILLKNFSCNIYVISLPQFCFLMSYTLNNRSSCDGVIDLNAAFASDGEEFSEDSILQDLRRRRAVYLTMLRQLDKALVTCS